MQTKLCDKCGQEAITTVKVESPMTTTVQADLCQECFTEFKKLVRWVVGQEVIESDKPS